MAEEAGEKTAAELDEEVIEQLWLRYRGLCHAVQTGVQFEQTRGSQDGSPKHLRTGVNMSKCDHAALVRLLVAKGVFTDLEYITELVLEAEREVKRYEDRILEQYDVKVTLG